MQIKNFEFSLQELAGAMGDFGTLAPLAVGYIVVCGMDPCGLLVMMGLANIVTGVIYRLPMPIEPMKVLAVMAIARAWTPEKILMSGIVMGVVWLLMGVTGAMDTVARFTPRSVIRGVQLSLGALLGIEGLKLMHTSWLLGLAAIVVVIVLRTNRYAPAAIVLLIGGLFVVAMRGQFPQATMLSISLPSFAMPHWRQFWPVLRDGGLAQIPLTATNAVIATSALIHEYWPGRHVTHRQLSFNQGVINIVGPLFGGMPLCHGAGGLAGQHYFGARTGGANIIEGGLEILAGVFLAGGIAALFAAFPSAIVGAMMFLVGIEMIKFARDLKPDRNLITVGATVAASLTMNMAVGFFIGMVAHYLIALRRKAEQRG